MRCLLLKGAALLLALALTGCIAGTVNRVGLNYSQGEQEVDATSWWSASGGAYFEFEETGVSQIELCTGIRLGWEDLVEDKRTWRNVRPSLCTALPLGERRR